MIEVSALSKRFGEVQALHNLSFTVEKGSIVGFLGANGAGKTTTMDIICGCIGCDEGSVKVGGIDVLEDPLEAKRRIGYLPDEPPIYDDMRVEEYIAYAAHLNKVPRQEVKRQVDETLERLSLGDVRRRLIGNLSKGYRQRVGLAQAIVHNPDVLILDEPTEGLDPNQIIHIRELIQQLGGQHTIMLSSHILSEVENTCDEIIIIHKGRIVQQGSHSQLLSSLKQEKQYRVHVADKADGFAQDLKGIEGIEVQKIGADALPYVDFILRGDSGALDLVARRAIDGNYGIRGLQSQGGTLEDVFLQLTN